MKHIIAGTNRQGSNTLILSKLIQSYFLEAGEAVEILDLNALEVDHLTADHMAGKKPLPEPIQKALNDITNSDGLYFVIPEYNGGAPGVLKMFIDFWKFPESFESRPVAFTGLAAGIWGGLKPVEHISQVMAYRNAYQFPERVFVKEVYKILKDGKIEDPLIQGLLKKQVSGFIKFCKALKSEGLDANSVNAKRTPQ